jgi:hypothetical protein
MANGKLILFRKDNFSSFALLDIIGSFNIEDNLNETPSNMKVKAITSNSFREEFEVNTVAFHEDTNSWWVIKSDESTYLITGEYEHEIQLVELLEFYSYRHLPNCAFAPNTYTLLQMLNRLFSIGKLTSPTLTIPNPLPSFLDQNKIMPFLSFENFTVANAIKNIGRAINAIPKVTATYSTSGGVFYLIGSFVLTFIDRNGLPNAILENLNTHFEIAYEKNMNSSDQFTTRSVSNITNAKSSSLVMSPQKGGYKNISPESPQYNPETAVITLPSKIDSIEYMRVFFEVELKLNNEIIFKSYYSDENVFYNELRSRLFTSPTRVILFNGSTFNLTTDQYNLLNNIVLSDFPNANEQAILNSTDIIDNGYNSVSERWLKNKMVFKNSFEFNQIDDTVIKERTCSYEKFSNTIKMSKTYREGLTIGSSIVNPESGFVNGYYMVDSNAGIRCYLQLSLNSGSFLFPTKVYTPNALVQVAYYPIADIKISIDNDNDAQDEKFFNQSGKVVDAVSASKLITSHTNDSVEGTKIRNARYDSISNILPVGQLVRDSNQIYVISQRSIDGQIKNGNQYYNVIYTLSRNRVARSENIVADSSVISYKTPDDNLISRSQLYKDYIELSLVNQNQDIPYLNMGKVLVLSDTLAGTNFDYTVLAKNQFSSTTVRYVKNPTVFDLHKSKLINVNWQSNNILDYRVEDDSAQNPIQTPIVYTDNFGKATNFELLFLDNTNLNQAISDYNNPYNASTYNPLVPFTDLTRVPNSFYVDDVVADGRFSIRIQEPNYTKDPFEIPVFEYMIQGNDDYNPLGNIVIGNDLFTTFTGNITYHYVINNGNRFTAENADKILGSSGLSGENDRRVIINRVLPTRILLKLYSNYSGTPTQNTNAITNVGFYAIDWDTISTNFNDSVKFLFAINDYVESGINDKNDIRVFINNWKI